MGTKQIRLNNTDQIRSRITEFQRKKINIVLHDGNVFIGTLIACSDTGITIANMRQKKVYFALTKINEIYFDTKA